MRINWAKNIYGVSYVKTLLQFIVKLENQTSYMEKFILKSNTRAGHCLYKKAHLKSVKFHPKTCEC